MYLICSRTLALQVEGSIALRQDAEAFGSAKPKFAGTQSMFGQAVVGVSYESEASTRLDADSFSLNG